jgi:spore coat polysaccharide biosynthesis predicted glycosyltransferase SpsG
MLGFLSLSRCRFSIETNNKDLVRKFIPDIDFAIYARGLHANEGHFDIAIVDLLTIGQKEAKHIKRLSGIIVCIDDEGPGLKGQDYLIRPNVLGLRKIPGMLADKYLTGREYIILHPDFAAASLKKKKIPAQVKQVLVCFGGSDPGNLMLRLAPLLKKLDHPVKFHVILGAAAADTGKITAILKNDARFLVSRNVAHMADAFSCADAALLSAGTLLYEACCLGIPSLVIAQNKQQEKEARILDTAGAVVNLGVYTGVSDETLTRALEELLDNPPLRERMFQKGRKLIAPNGASRIASKLLAHLAGGTVR